MGLTATTVRRAIAGHRPVDPPALPGRTNHLDCGVLVPLMWRPRPTVLLTVRSVTLRDHGGEVSFPGGKREDGDPDLAATALRETREELGVEADEVFGRLSSVPLYTSDHRIFPYVAGLTEQAMTPNPDEVSEVLELELEALLSLPKVEAIPYNIDGSDQLAPVFPTAGHLIYGGTAIALYELLCAVSLELDRAPPTLTAGRYGWNDVLPAGFEVDV